MSSTDYDRIKELIDDIVGVDTMQGKNLKKAIKNYFETKPVSVKLVSPITREYANPFSIKVQERDDEMIKAMDKYTAKLKSETETLKKKGQFKGTCSIDGHWDD